MPYVTTLFPADMRMIADVADELILDGWLVTTTIHGGIGDLRITVDFVDMDAHDDDAMTFFYDADRRELRYREPSAASAIGWKWLGVPLVATLGTEVRDTADYAAWVAARLAHLTTWRALGTVSL